MGKTKDPIYLYILNLIYHAVMVWLSNMSLTQYSFTAYGY